MNICMFTNTYLPHVGGVARSVSSFAEDLQKLGHNIMIVAPTFPTDEAHLEDHNVLRVP
ncbi:MAG TPA: glycosyltransferase family 4 protein, partial [Desulfobacteraceae bacterium]|nr:glycosyltransferase family 4 protein [Desulfobacteraceae bacterium]